MASSSVKTIWMSQKELCAQWNTPFVPDPFSTLNEYFNIRSGASIPANQQPRMDYLVIGRGGKGVEMDGANEPLFYTKLHKITHARLFTHLAFVARDVNDDLDETARERFRLRRLENHGGVDKFIYYGLKTSFNAGNIIREKVDLTGGSPVITPYVPTNSQLSPTPVSISNSVVNMSSGIHIVTYIPTTVTLSPDDISEIINAAEVMFGSPRYATINEMATVQGVDQTVSSTDGGISVSYKEVIAAQCSAFITANHDLTEASDGLQLNFKVRTTQALLI